MKQMLRVKYEIIFFAKIALKMKLSNQEIADRLNRIGQLYQLQKDHWRSKAFLDASKAIEDLPESARQTELLALPGSDKSVEEVIEELGGGPLEVEESPADFPAE
jgi:hypothetical protein